MVSVFKVGVVGAPLRVGRQGTLGPAVAESHFAVHLGKVRPGAAQTERHDANLGPPAVLQAGELSPRVTL